MVRKLVRQMLAAQIISAMTVTLCLLIDSIMIGRFLGVEALSAYQLANPVLLIVAAAAIMLSAGTPSAVLSASIISSSLTCSSVSTSHSLFHPLTASEFQERI